MPTDIEKQVMEEDATQLCDEARDKLRRIKRMVLARLNEEVVMEQAELRRSVSKRLHELHAAGLPKAALRRATRAYGNSDVFNKNWWEPYTPETEVDLRVNTLKPVEAVKQDYRWVSADVLEVEFADGTSVVVEGIYVEHETKTDGDEEWITHTPVYDNPESYGALWGPVATIVTKALKERGDLDD